MSQTAGQIAIAVDNALAYEEIVQLKEKLAQEKLYLEEEIRSEMDFEQIVGSSPAIKHVLQLVETVAPNDSTVLLLGETGTGKELIARAIHDRTICRPDDQRPHPQNLRISHQKKHTGLFRNNLPRSTNSGGKIITRSIMKRRNGRT